VLDLVCENRQQAHHHFDLLPIPAELLLILQRIDVDMAPGIRPAFTRKTGVAIEHDQGGQLSAAACPRGQE
jgi:hypothetical protein